MSAGWRGSSVRVWCLLQLGQATTTPHRFFGSVCHRTLRHFWVKVNDRILMNPAGPRRPLRSLTRKSRPFWCLLAPVLVASGPGWQQPLRADGPPAMEVTNSSSSSSTSSSGNNRSEASNRSQQGMSLVRCLKGLAHAFRKLFRGLYICLVSAPLIVTGPLAYKSQWFRSRIWYGLLYGTVMAMGPVFLKLGQWASTRQDLLPPELCRQLSRLQRRCPAHPWSHTRELLEDAYGPGWGSLFPSFPQEPVGSGVCAQVYRAELDVSQLDSSDDLTNLPGPLPVAVKVAHPGIRSQFQLDLSIFRGLLSTLSFLVPSLKWLSLTESLEEFANLMEQQLDLKNEVNNLRRFRANFRKDPLSTAIVFPRPVYELCYSDIIVETFEEGVHIGSLLPGSGNTGSHSPFSTPEVAEAVRRRLASVGVDLLLKMVFEHNFVHGDLHPGNILVRGIPDKVEDEEDLDGLKLVLLDTGITASLEPQDYDNFRSTFIAIVKGDGREVGRLFLDRSVNFCQDRPAFIREMDQIVMEVRSQQLSLAKVDVGNLLMQVFNTLRQHRVKLDPSFASVVLAIIILEGLGRSLDPNLDLMWKAGPYVLRMPKVFR